MENLKHTKEYAEKLAKSQSIYGVGTEEFNYTNGYMKAIEETAAPDMLEALEATKMLNLHLYEEGTIGNRVYIQIINTINKATK